MNLYRVVKDFSPEDSEKITTEESLVTALSVEQVCYFTVQDIACDARYEITSITNVGSVVRCLENEDFEHAFDPDDWKPETISPVDNDGE